MPNALGVGISIVFTSEVAIDMSNHVLLSYHIPGTLSQNVFIYWAVPFNCNVIHISAVGSNANNASLSFGISTDPDSILEASTVGDLLVPNVYDSDDWSIVNPEGQLNDNDVAVLLVDYDGASGTAVSNLTVNIAMLVS